MPMLRRSNAPGPTIFCGAFGVLCLLLPLTLSSCKRHAAENNAKSESTEEPSSLAGRDPAPKKNPGHEIYAVWYDVPEDSLAKQRAGKGELTAEHNHLRLGTMVRITHLKSGKSVIVRITDRGITNRRAGIDLCKEAAEQLGIVSEGMARVRMEVLPDDKGLAAPPDLQATVAHP